MEKEINDYLRLIALHSPLQNQLGYTESPDAVSSDFVGMREAATLDATATKVQGKNIRKSTHENRANTSANAFQNRFLNRHFLLSQIN